MQSIGNWVMGGLATGTGLLGLYISSRATDNFIYSVGLLIAVACGFFVVNMVKQAFDGAEEH